MATPSHSNPPTQPSSASKKPPGHATTPSARGIASPAPRSIPSPAAMRKEAANHPTASSYGSKTLGGTPMMQSLSQSGAASSPSGHMGSFGMGTPHGLGLDLGSGTPGHMMNVPTPLLQSVAMMPSESEMGGVAQGTATKRNEEEDRKAKMRSVLTMIGRKKGRCSEESIARIARRVGLQNDIDVNLAPLKETAEEKRKRLEEEQREAGNRSIIMSGSAEKFLIEVKLKEHVAQDVVVEFYGSKALMDQGKPASKVLCEDLAAPNGVLLQTHLDSFGANLNALARLDKLSSAANGSINCFEAIAGIHASLKKLHELEKEAVRTLNKYTGPDAERRIEREVMCKRSGKPVIHENGRLGLSLNYWESGSLHTASKRDDPAAMDIDNAESNQKAKKSKPTTWSLHIDAEKLPASFYPSLRVSDAWLPQTLELPPSDSGNGIPWLEPPPTYVPEPSQGQNETMTIDGQRLPDLRFVAKFDPPLVVPAPTAMAILNAVGLEHTAEVTYNCLYPFEVLKITQQNLAGPIQVEHNVDALREGEVRGVTHRYRLDVSKGGVSRRFDHLPFSHPRELIDLLPTLRQWASVSDLLFGTFGEDPKLDSDFAVDQVDNETHTDDNSEIAHDSPMALNDLTDSVDAERLQVDINLAIASNATLDIAYRDPDRAIVSDVALQVLPNADIVVVDRTAIGKEDETEEERAKQVAGTSEHCKKLAKALDVCGDLGVWVEWMKKLKA